MCVCMRVCMHSHHADKGTNGNINNFVITWMVSSQRAALWHDMNCEKSAWVAAILVKCFALTLATAPIRCATAQSKEIVNCKCRSMRVASNFRLQLLPANLYLTTVKHCVQHYFLHLPHSVSACVSCGVKCNTFAHKCCSNTFTPTASCMFMQVHIPTYIHRRVLLRRE